MTLPFRRRHHDDEAWHDRARALLSASLLAPLDAADEAWLDDHLGRCPECAADREGYLDDRAMLRALRDAPPTPPRDLWARTAGAIEREASAGRRGLLGRALGPTGPRGVPLGPLAGVLVAAVVLVVALLPPGRSIVPTPTSGSSQPIAVASPGATPLVVNNQVAWVQQAPDGSYRIVIAQVGEVCPTGDQGCAPINGTSPSSIDLPSAPQAVVISPHSDQVAVVGSGASDGSVVIVTVPTAAPSLPPGATATPAAATPVAPTASAGPSQPAGSAGASPLPSSSGSPAATGHAIIRGVTVVGEPGYSADGEWFAFSARPQGGEGGPDLYVWRVGTDAAIRLTANGATYFAGWYGNQIIASGIRTSPAPDDASPAPSEAAASTAPPASAGPADTAPPSADGSAAPAASEPPAGLGEAHPFSYLLDPATGARTAFARDDVWLPAIDPTGRFVVYWSGTVVPDDPTAASAALVKGWRPATGRLVLDGWDAPLAPASSAPAPASPEASASQSVPSSETPGPSAAAIAPDAGTPDNLVEAPFIGVAPGPAGSPITLAEGPLSDFNVHFDPTGTRLAVWTANPGDPSIGPLWLIVLDPALGGPDPSIQPLPAPGVMATRGFSIDDGRLGWVTPQGQDGQPSSVQVLAWKGDDFGHVQTAPGGNPQIVR